MAYRPSRVSRKKKPQYSGISLVRGEKEYASVSAVPVVQNNARSGSCTARDRRGETQADQAAKFE